MIDDFDDCCLWTYVVVDELWQRLGPLFRRPGPAPACSDSELLTLALVGECRGWEVETELLSHWQEHPGTRVRVLFPRLPSQSRVNRRRRQLADAFNLIRRAILGLLGAAADRQCVIDSLPVPARVPYLSCWRGCGLGRGLRVPAVRPLPEDGPSSAWQHPDGLESPPLRGYPAATRREHLR